MQSSNVRVATLAAIFTLPIIACIAQSAAASADAQATSQTTAQSSAEANAISERYMTSVDTELTSKLDSKNAAVGQEVTAKTRETAKLADGTTLPKGTKLVGHVTQAQAHTRDHTNSALAMTFDRAELKNGQSVPLRSIMRAVAPPASTASASNSLMADEAVGPVSAGASAGGMGTGGARGGLGGGVVGGAARGVGQTAGGLGQTAGGLGQATGSTIGGTAREARSATDATAGIAGGAVAQAGETVSAAPRASGLPGVMLSTSGAADVSGTLMAAGKNITLDTGTQITLGVIAR